MFLTVPVCHRSCFSQSQFVTGHVCRGSGLSQVMFVTGQSVTTPSSHASTCSNDGEITALTAERTVSSRSIPRQMIVIAVRRCPVCPTGVNSGKQILRDLSSRPHALSAKSGNPRDQSVADGAGTQSRVGRECERGFPLGQQPVNCLFTLCVFPP
ncbi:hypothetical protein ElyMa_005289700 [Elysia marginata]|uniref:Uncharacterized protein n=1 Tax=Elysia marginata TaxID=1093978 RepID=A0AAV4K384_9GAST|nr:hypothetical protein ElyMa_005289700 [Elysia marginata]